MEPSPEDVILEEEIDPNYDPTEEELVEYATWLGMDLANHKDLLWIAKDALTAPLPNDWKPCLTEEDEIYYFNFTTGRSIWDHPCDEYYRNIYKEEAEKLNQDLQQGRQSISGPNSRLRPLSKHSQVQTSSKTVVDTNPISLQMDKTGVSQSSWDSMERRSVRDLTVDSKSFFMSCFPIELLSSSKSNLITRSLPGPHIRGRQGLSNLKGRSFDSMIRLYSANNTQNEGGMPSADFYSVQEATGNSLLGRTTSTAMVEEHPHMDIRWQNQTWMRGEEKRALERKICQIKDRIEKKLVDEERIVLQQERVEMLERVCKQVQEEESHILDSLRREILERVERNIRDETQALLAVRRKEIIDEVEQEMQAEKLVLKEFEKNQENRHLEMGTGAVAPRGGREPKETGAPSSQAKKPNTSKTLNEEEFLLSGRDDGAAPRRHQEVEEGEAIHMKTQEENGSLLVDSLYKEEHKDGAQKMHEPSTETPKILADHEEGDGITKEDSTQKFETECREGRFEKRFSLQDLRTSILLKLEVFMKFGASTDRP